MVTTRAASKGASATPAASTPSSSPHRRRGGGRGRSEGPSGATAWAHAPSRLTLLWFAVSLPLVVWDSAYVLLRPWTMEGGPLHWPLWVPYALYGEVDHIYGWKAFRARNGFTAAQGALNVAETALYLAYIGIYYYHSSSSSSVAATRGGGAKVLSGRPAALAVLLAFSAAVMTLSKTVLYWLNEYFSGFDNIGHNSLPDLVLLWIIPNGAWLVFPTYMIYVMGGEIVEGLTVASIGVPIKSE